MLSGYLLIGEILKPQGITGEVKVQPITDDPGRFLRLKQVFLEKGEGYEPWPLIHARVGGGFVYLTLEGVSSREAAEKLRGTKLFVDRANAVPLEENESFIADLIGCKAVDTQGRLIGTLVDVLQPGRTDVYVFDTPKGRMLMPALASAIPKVDVQARLITLDADRLSEVAFFED